MQEKSDRELLDRAALDRLDEAVRILRGLEDDMGELRATVKKVLENPLVRRFVK